MSKRSFATTSELETPSVVSSSTTLETGAGSRSKHELNSRTVRPTPPVAIRAAAVFFPVFPLPRAHSEKKCPNLDRTRRDDLNEPSPHLSSPPRSARSWDAKRRIQLRTNAALALARRTVPPSPSVSRVGPRAKCSGFATSAISSTISTTSAPPTGASWSCTTATRRSRDD